MKRLLLLGLLIFCLSSAAGAADGRESDKYLIRFTGAIPADAAEMVAQAGGTLLRSHPQIGWISARSADPGFVARMAGRRGVATVQRDVTVRWPSLEDARPVDGSGKRAAVAESGEPAAADLFPCQWQLRQIDAPGAWAQGALGSLSAKVALIDTGADATHVDLAGRIDLDESASVIEPNAECGAEDATADDPLGHGTFLASLVSTNGIHLASVAPQTQVVAVKVVHCNGDSEFSDMVAGILYAADLADVTAISISLGDFVNRNDPGGRETIRSVRDAVQYAYRQGKLVVTVAGNQHVDLRTVHGVAVPTESGEAIGVYATNVRGTLASYSNWGFPAAWIGAPGGDRVAPKRPFPGCTLPPERQGFILGACASSHCGGANDQYIVSAGTSLSAPLVAGVAALVDGESGGALSGETLKVILKKRADDLGEPGTDPVYGHGRVDAARAVRH